jgi:hypothetical protein
MASPIHRSLGLNAKLPRSCELCGQQPVQSVPFSRVQISVTMLMLAQVRNRAPAGPPNIRASKT